MKRLNRHGGTDRRTNLSDRMAAAFGSLFFTVPLLGLYWLVVNIKIAVFAPEPIPLSFAAWVVVGMAALGFICPRLLPAVFGALCDLLIGIARWW